ncbi:hypothetical protein U9M48_038190 [Paspalum notatum var. saurae]|uniref:Uncharacterized protein n=1 Tax=Paspalum notatum var. saurae TaxID=547442 RepID=A0AAQ3UH34_PASNO
MDALLCTTRERRTGSSIQASKNAAASQHQIPPCPVRGASSPAPAFAWRIQHKIHFSETEDFAVGDSVSSEYISAGGHLWIIHCYPRGILDEDIEYVSINLEVVSSCSTVNTIFQVFLLGKDGVPSFSHEQKSVDVFSKGEICIGGWDQFLERSVIESLYLSNGWVTFLCNIIVLGADTIAVPPSNIGRDFSLLLDGKVGTDVSFIVKGETIQAHRAIVAARSPVFKAGLFGSTADATSSITLQDMEPATFKAMLGFMYTDELPECDEHGDSIDMMQHLLAAADRYALDRLKLMCASKLWDHMSEDTFASILVCAETYNCPELKSKCFEFFAVDENLKKIIFTDGYLFLVGKFQSLVAELKERFQWNAGERYLNASIDATSSPRCSGSCLLRSIYKDALPGGDNAALGDSPAETMRRLPVAAGRYALDRLKLLCARWLWDNISVDTFASTLACAETFSCPELKSRCIDFFAHDDDISGGSCSQKVSCRWCTSFRSWLLSSKKGFIKFKFDFSETNHLPGDAAVPCRNFISAAGHSWEIVCLRGGGGGGGHHWEIVCLPGDCPVTKGNPKPAVKAIFFKALVIGADGAPASLSRGNHWSEHRVTYLSTATGDGDDGPPTIRCLGGRLESFNRRELESDGYLIDGCFTFMCGITVLHDDDDDGGPGGGAATVHSEAGDDGSDVSFSVDGETFRAHRAVLAASSPVFRALLFGSMAEATMDLVTLHDIQPAAFRILLRFVYTDTLGSSSSPPSASAAEVLQHLVAVADMYDVDGLKLACAQKLCDHVSHETVAATLACAETHGCPELKKRCIAFYVDNFRDLVLNEEYLRLLQRFPSIAHEIKAKCHKKRKPNARCYGPEWDNN